MPNIPLWPHHKIRELLARADAIGWASAELDSTKDAEAFRFAIYHFRRNNDIGQDLLITIDGATVCLTKRRVPEVTILQEIE